MNTVFLHVPPVFRSSVPKVYRTSNSVRSPEKENNVEKRTARRRGGGRKAERFCGIRVLELNRAKEGKEWKLRSRELERARSLTRDCSVNDGLTHDVTG